MAFTQETGTGAAGSNAYGNENGADTYHEDRNNTDWTGDTSGQKEAALIRASAAIDAQYRSQFPGYKRNARSQAMEWPRIGAVDVNGYVIAIDAIPQEIINAVYEAALRELVEPGAMLPDVEAGGNAKRIKAGSVEIEKFTTGATSKAEFSLIDGILQPIIGGGQTSQYTANAVRA